MNKGFVIIKEEVLQQLLDNFYEVCSLPDECDIYEGDKAMQKMKDWTEEKFGRKISKDNYE